MEDDDQIRRLAGADLQGADGASFALLEVRSRGRTTIGWFEDGDQPWIARMLTAADVAHAGAPLEDVRSQTTTAVAYLRLQLEEVGAAAGASTRESREREEALRRAAARLEADLSILSTDHLGSREDWDPAAGPSATYVCDCCGREVNADDLDDLVVARMEKAIAAGNLDLPLMAVGLDREDALAQIERGNVQAIVEATISRIEVFHEADRPRILWRSVARNAPCPCGSGEKFKLCCGRVLSGG